MFKLSRNGNIILNVAEQNPPSASFVVEALERSQFSECEIDHDSINSFFSNGSFEKEIVVGKQLDAEFTVTISADKMQAIGKLTAPKGGSMISFDDSKKAIIDAGVTRGYKQVLLEKILQQQFLLDPGEEVEDVVAQGRMPEDGKSSKLIIHVETLKEQMKKPKMREDGTVDMRDFGAMSSVAPGTILATQRPATPGKEGFNVVGGTIAAKSGESLPLTPGEGTQISPHNPLELIATIAGCPSESTNGMRVDDVYTIGEVDVRSGHVDFSGSVIVMQDVAPGMRVVAKGDITVMGSVESSELISGGNIIVKQAVIGKVDRNSEEKLLTCRLVAQEDVHLSIAQYAQIQGKNIFIDKQSHHCNFTAEQLVQIGADDPPKGKLLGGEIKDAQMVIAGEIGSESGTKMVVNLATRGTKMLAQSESCNKSLSQIDDQLSSLQEAIEKASQVKDPEKKQLMLTKIGATQQHYCQQAEEAEREIAELSAKLTNLLDSTKLVANVSSHPGVEINIFDKGYKTARTYPPCGAALKDGKVEIEFKTS